MNPALRSFGFVLASLLGAATAARAHVIAFDLQGKAGPGLLSGNETRAVSGAAGRGGETGTGIVFNDQTRVLTINIAWGSIGGFSDLTGPAQGGHIHGPTASSGTESFNEDAPVLIGLDPRQGWKPDAANGGFSGNITLTEEQAAQLLAGRFYLNIHTATNAGGEIRANLVQPPFNPSNPIQAVIPRGEIVVELEPVATGLISPTLLVSPPDASDRQFIVEQTGQVRIIENGRLLSAPFLDLAGRMVALSPGYDERGLLGLAFDPGFADPASPGFRRLFTYTSEPVSGTADLPDPYATTLNHQSVVASWRVSAENRNVVDPASRREIVRIDQPQSNHNGGHLAFGPDGFLYIALGDGGGANDTAAGHNPSIGNGQDNSIALGKILRIDVNGTNAANGRYGIPASNPFANGGGVREIFASGFRNPYRFSVQGQELLVGDVGQRSVEELNRVQLGGNHGWRYKEGTFRFNASTGSVSDDLSGLPGGLVDPIAQYDRDEGISIIGGFVYSGTAIPVLAGRYVFGDYARPGAGPAGRLFYYDFAAAEIREFTIGRQSRPLGIYVKGLGQDQRGELYVMGSTISGPSGTAGIVYRIVPVASRMLNISTRLRVETGENALIGGFIVTGSESRRVIVRAIGPSLTASGVTGALADPTLELFGPDPSVPPVATNDNWRDSQAQEIQETGIPPASDAESAIVATLSPAAYTAVVRGKNNMTGVGLVEVYDLGQTQAARLANISTRGRIGSESANFLIGGIIAGGGSSGVRLVIRAIGPSLSKSGVSDPLQDPTITLFDANGVATATNDNWRDDPAQAQAIADAGLALTDDRESGMLVTIPPASGTAIVRGKNGMTGVSLLEIYHLQ